ncbi:Molybdenum cofactor biosynthesis protein B [Crateriforma conspicua]|uniref:Molybdenum cofactor biosynthesis protein B n=1 Tax=Crateriforma conspicua TaxID=2527996 RepID=A0A5C6FJ57_9PLAN|nr:MogA/MoaB family molybdenum cofactor biosynthesis protein [Crateriforma conspicua]TWU60975.1 Molybdenum cofactor biosynthesis protein B [Crateriforma conspicua]
MNESGNKKRSADENCGCVPVDGPIRVAVITLSDTRSRDNDRSGDRIVDLLKSAGHQLVQRELIRDEPQQLIELLDAIIAQGDAQAVVTTGGTGLAARDQTIDAIQRILDAELPGFGEHFRRLSIDEIGRSAMLSRATAGRIGRTMIFCLPGSTGAVQTGVQQCILPILRHTVGLVWDDAKSESDRKDISSRR